MGKKTEQTKQIAETVVKAAAIVATIGGYFKSIRR